VSEAGARCRNPEQSEGSLWARDKRALFCFVPPGCPGRGDVSFLLIERRSHRFLHHPHLALRYYYEASAPAANLFLPEYVGHTCNQAPTIRGAKANQEDSTVGSWNESPNVAEVEILGNQKACIVLRRFPYLKVALAAEIFLRNSVYVVAELGEDCSQLHRKVLVQLDSHRCGDAGICGVAGTGRSSPADAAAKAMAACTSSALSAGKAARISSTESPAARLASTVRSVTRVSRKTASPPQIAGFLTILLSQFIGDTLVDSYHRFHQNHTIAHVAFRNCHKKK